MVGRPSSYCLFSTLLLSVFSSCLTLMLTSLLPTLFSILSPVFCTSLPMSAAMFCAVLPMSAAVFSAVFWSYWTVTLFPSLLTLQAPSINSGMASRMRMGFLRGLEGSTPRTAFRLRFDWAGQHGEHRGPRGDVLPERFRIDLIEGVVRRVVE